jgi:lysozyme family protein
MMSLLTNNRLKIFNKRRKKMKTTFDEIIDVVLEHEGGYVNDPKDPGGETKYGVSKRAYPDVNIKNLSEDGAKDIYRRDYWEKNRCTDLPDDLRHIYFDMCINMGASRAVKILQETANAKGADLKIDGGIGPKTIGAMRNVELQRVRAYRVKYYANLVDRKPDLGKFYYGWFKRSLEV